MSPMSAPSHGDATRGLAGRTGCTARAPGPGRHRKENREPNMQHTKLIPVIASSSLSEASEGLSQGQQQSNHPVLEGKKRWDTLKPCWHLVGWFSTQRSPGADELRLLAGRRRLGYQLIGGLECPINPNFRLLHCFVPPFLLDHRSVVVPKSSLERSPGGADAAGSAMKFELRSPNQRL